MMKDIPGFYYDPGTRRYFRITADNRSAAHTAAARYSRSAVQRRAQDNENIKKLRQLHLEKFHNSVKRAALLGNSGHITTLARELGYVSHFNSGDMWGRQYSVTSLLRPLGTPIPGLTRPNSPISEIAHDSQSGTTFISNFDGQILVKSDSNDTGLMGSFSPCSLMLADPASCLTTSQPPSSLLIGATGSGVVFTNRIEDMLSHPNVVQSNILADNLGHIWACTANPSPASSHCVVAIASMQPTLLTLTESQSYRTGVPGMHVYNDWGTLHGFHTSPEVLSAAWQTPHVASWGYRDGGIDLTDIRAPSRSLRLLHPTTVCEIRHLGSMGYHVLAAGLRDQLAMYDLRWCPPPNMRTASPPYLTYPSYTNAAYLRAGFDVSPDLELIASGGDRGGVTLLNLWRGTTYYMRRSDTLAQTTVRRIKFVASRDATEGYGRCLLSVNDDVENWTFGKQSGIAIVAHPTL